MLSIEETIGYRHETRACAVCGKNVEGGGGFARVNKAGRLVELCCPLCLETFQTNPAPYLRVIEKKEYFRYLSNLEISPVVAGSL
jgi:ribosomal protein L24E